MDAAGVTDHREQTIITNNGSKYTQSDGHRHLLPQVTSTRTQHSTCSTTLPNTSPTHFPCNTTPKRGGAPLPSPQTKTTPVSTPRSKAHLALFDVLIALVEVRLNAVPVVDLDMVADLEHGGADSLERPILRGLHHTHLPWG